MSTHGQQEQQQQPPLDPSSSSANNHPASIMQDDSVNDTQHQQHDDNGTYVSTTHASRAPSTITLDPTDYVGWAMSMESMLKFFNLWDCVSPRDAQTSTSSVSASNISVGEAAKLQSRTREAHYILVSALRDPESRRVLLQTPSGDPCALWSALKRRFASMPNSTKAALFSQLLSLRQIASESVQQFADRISLLRHRLSQVGRAVSDDDVITTLVNGVSSTVAVQVSAFYNSRENAKFEDLVEIARGEEARLQVTAGVKISSSSSNNSAALSASTHSSAASNTCHNCGSSDHFIAACPKIHRHGAGRRTATAEEIAAGRCPRPGHRSHNSSECRVKNSATAAAPSSNTRLVAPTYIDCGSAEVSIGGVAVLTASADHEKPAIWDSGAGSTILASSGTLLNSSNAPDVRITVANGQVLTSPSRGTAVVKGPGGVQLHVKNSLQHPQVDRTLLSVSSLLEDSSKFKRVMFEKDYAAAVTPAGEILITATKKNGVYEMDVDSDRREATAKVFAGEAQTSISSSTHPHIPAPDLASIAPLVTTNTIHPMAELLHQRFCHRSLGGMKLLQAAGAVDDLQSVKIAADLHHSCIGCAKGKAHRQPFTDHVDAQLQPTATHLLARVVADVAGPISVESLGGARYFLILIDEFSEFAFVAFLTHKSEGASAIINWSRQARTRHNRDIVEFHSDGGGEFVNEQLSKYFRQTGTLQSTTVPHTPQHNGRAERIIRTISEWTNAIISHAGAPKVFWAHAVSTVVYTRNLTQVCKNGDKSLTPYARWFGISGPTPISHLRVFGCDADVLYTKAPGSKLPKLSQKSRRCMFIGYDDNKNHAWKFYDPHTHSVFSSRDATFHEQQFTVSHNLRDESAAAADGEELDTDEQWLTRTTLDNETKLMEIVSKEEAEKAASNSSSAPTNISADSDDSDSSDEAASEIDSDAEAQTPHAAASSSSTPAVKAAAGRQPRAKIQLPPRERHHRDAHDYQLQRYGMVNNNLAQARFVFIGFTASDSPDPTADLIISTLPKAMQLPRNATEAMQHPEWRKAREKELSAHAKNGTWTFVPLPPGAKALGYKEVYKIKLNADGTPGVYKVRLTAQGFGQRDGRDYHENHIYAPVLAYNTFRLILAFVCAEDYDLQHLDVVTAFLNASVEEDIYMKVPEGVDAPPGTVCKLVKALYGIKQAPFAWHADIAATLVSTLGFTASAYDPCLFIKRSRTGRVLLFPLFVDDCFPANHIADRDEMNECLKSLMSVYEITHNGEAKQVLGMRITRDRTNRILKLDQEIYIERLLADYDATHCKPASTPAIITTATTETSDEVNIAATDEQRTAYQALVGSLQYATIATRPDIAQAVNFLARGLVTPTVSHRAAAWRVLRYLRGTTTLGLTFAGSQQPQQQHRSLIGYSDANWAGLGEENARSISGWLVKIGSGPIAWGSTQQRMVALSVCESEYVAATLAAQQIIWSRGILTDCGLTLTKATPLFCDCRSAIQLASSNKISQRTKHINVRYHFIRELIADGTLRMDWLRSEDQPADALTKPLGPHIFLRLRPFLLGSGDENEVNKAPHDN